MRINSLRPFWPEAIFLKSVNNVSFFIKFICFYKPLINSDGPSVPRYGHIAVSLSLPPG